MELWKTLCTYLFTYANVFCENWMKKLIQIGMLADKAYFSCITCLGFILNRLGHLWLQKIWILINSYHSTFVFYLSRL